MTSTFQKFSSFISTMSSPVICIPRVFPNINEKRIRSVFDDLNVGEIERVDIVAKTTRTGETFNRVFVHFKRWFTNENAIIAKNRLTEGKEVKIIYDDPWFWKVSLYREPAPREQHKPALKQGPRIEFDESSPRPPSQDARRHQEHQAPRPYEQRPPYQNTRPPYQNPRPYEQRPNQNPRPPQAPRPNHHQAPRNYEQRPPQNPRPNHQVPRQPLKEEEEDEQTFHNNDHNYAPASAIDYGAVAPVKRGKRIVMKDPPKKAQEKSQEKAQAKAEAEVGGLEELTSAV